MHENIVSVAGLHYRRATWPRRIAARMIDIAILTAFCVLTGETYRPLAVLLSIIYLFLGNGLLGGRSIGKHIMGIKVIDARHGGAITPAQDFVRHRYLFYYNFIFFAFVRLGRGKGLF
ncbi:MAG TPA: RDD family protein [Chthoniobacteraceae bacterium]|nr:RDD family protein [Chthoniobacteraceae bacterium]